MIVAGNPVVVELTLDENGTALTGKASVLNALTNEGFRYLRHRTPGGTVTTVTPASNPWTEDGSTGVYRATIVASAAEGTYSGVIAYSESGRIPQTFNWSEQVLTPAQADPAAALIAQNLTVDAPSATEADKSIVAGDAETLAWSSTGWPSLSGQTATFQSYKLLTGAAVFASAKSVTITNAGQATQNLSVTLASGDTDDFTPGVAYRYEVNSTAGLLVAGKLSAREG